MTSEKIAQWKDELARMERLKANEDFQEVFGRRFKVLEKEHTDAAVSNLLSSEKRSEHIEAVHMARELSALLDVRISQLKADIAKYPQRPGQK